MFENLRYNPSQRTTFGFPSPIPVCCILHVYTSQRQLLSSRTPFIGHCYIRAIINIYTYIQVACAPKRLTDVRLFGYLVLLELPAVFFTVASQTRQQTFLPS